MGSGVSRRVMYGEMKGMHKVETVEQMPEEYRQTLLKIINALASTEFASVEQHQAWINKGPTAEDRFAYTRRAATSRLTKSCWPQGHGHRN